MSEKEHPFERGGRGPSLMAPFILAALMGDYQSSLQLEPSG
jgi:hypothetical protein